MSTIKMPENVSLKSARRKAVAVIEVLAAIAILSIVLLLAAKMTTALNQHRKSVERHRIALDAKTNLMNFAMAMPYPSVSETALNTRAGQLFPDGEWHIEVNQVDGGSVDAESGADLPAKKVVVDLAVNEAAQPSKFHQPLVLWRYSLGTQR